MCLWRTYRKNRFRSTSSIIFKIRNIILYILKLELILKQETCRKRQGNCFYCELALDFDKLDEHIEFCGSRTEKCLKCNQYIKAKDQSKHESTNCAFPPVQVQPPVQPQINNMTRYQPIIPIFNQNLIQRNFANEPRVIRRGNFELNQFNFIKF